MFKEKVKVKLVLCIALIMTIIASAVYFMAVGIEIYGARFYIFAAIATFFTFIIVHTILSSIFGLIEERDATIRASTQHLLLTKS